MSERFLAAVRTLSAGGLAIEPLIQTAEALGREGRNDLALQLYQLWGSFNPASPALCGIYFNLSVLQSGEGDLAGARASLLKALELNPEFAPAYINLGGLLERLGAADQAVLTWAQLVERLAAITGPALRFKLEALKQIARVWENNQFLANAELFLRQSLEIDPGQRDVAQHLISARMAQCAWPVVEPWAEVGREPLMRGIGPLSMAAWTDDPVLQLGCAAAYSRQAIGFPEPLFQHQPPAARPAGQRLRVGYLSSDLRTHAIGFLMPEVFELHDRARIEVFVYYCSTLGHDAQSARYRQAVEHWADVGTLGDEALARQIAADGIEILVDVNGYTREARTRVLALRPAPVIVNWLGYPGTMATPYHHYLIADEVIIPPGSECFYTEKVVRLPCYQPTDRRRRIDPQRPTRASQGLPEQGTVFCCFNGLHKLNPPVFARWLEILRQVPDSVLWLLEGGEVAVAALRQAAAAGGVDPARLVFAPKIANPQHLARYPLADLFLDTSPYGAHTTASDALWLGLPVLTVAGCSFPARVCASLVRAAGLPELVCADAAAYLERAVALGRAPEQLALYRERLVAGRDHSILFDLPGLVQRLEQLYGAMWQDFLDGRLPQPDLANLELYYELGLGQEPQAVDALTPADTLARYRTLLTRYHRRCPVPPDRRLWPGPGADGAAEESGA